MSSEKILERERARAIPTAVAAFGAVALLIASLAVGRGATASDSQAEVLMNFPDDRGTLLVAAILQAAGLALLVLPLFYLFQAASARSEQMRHGLIGITVAGPLFLAVAVVLGWVALDSAADTFAQHGALDIPLDDYADDLLSDEATYSASQGLAFAGTLGLVVGIVYTSLHAMRVGLLTRFWGSLGMALGVSVLFLGQLGLAVLFVALGLLIAGRWPGSRPPAWEEGRAVPWPTPGQPEEDDADRPADPDEFAATIEGSGQEVEGSAEDAAPQAGETPRKRKRRR
jgi:hypothetical protein